jgi:hypothetical protein
MTEVGEVRPVMCSRMHPGGHGRGSTGVGVVWPTVSVAGGGSGGGCGSGCVSVGDTGFGAPVSRRDMVPVDASTGTVSCQMSATSASSNAPKSQQSQSISLSRCATVISRSSMLNPPNEDSPIGGKDLPPAKYWP